MEYEVIPDAASAALVMPHDDERTRPSKPLLLLVVTSILSFGSHFGKHFLSSLGPGIMNRLVISRAAFGLTFSAQETPGILVPVLGSIVISATHVSFGAAAVVLASVVTLGQMLSAIATHFRSYEVLLLGRFLFGVGDGCLVVVQGAIVGDRFRHDGKMSLAFGTMLLSSRLSSYAGLASPKFFSDSLGLVPAIYLSAAACSVSLIAALMYALFLDSAFGNANSVNGQGLETASFFQEAWLAIRKLRFPFWLVACCWAMLASAVFTLLHFAADVAKNSTLPALSSREQLSGLVSGGILLLSAFLSPIAGIAQDRLGHRVHILGGACLLTCAGMALCAYGIGYSAVLVLLGIALVAIGFSVAPVTLLSCVALCVDNKSHLPTALGLYKASENVVMAQTHWIAGALRDNSGDYFWSLVFLSGIAALGCASAVGLSHTGKAKVLKAGCEHFRGEEKGSPPSDQGSTYENGQPGMSEA